MFHPPVDPRATGDPEAAGSAGAVAQAGPMSAVMSSPSRPSPDQSTQPISLSWHSIVVAGLAVADFIAGEQQRNGLVPATGTTGNCAATDERMATISASSVGPSTPPFVLRLRSSAVAVFS